MSAAINAPCAAQRVQQCAAAPVRCRPPALARVLLAARPRHCPRNGGAIAPRAAQKQSFTSFEEMIKSSPTPVLVDFYARWCGPCQIMSGILESVAPALTGKVKVAKVDAEKYSRLASKFNVHAYPCLILFKGGQPVDRIEGVIEARELQARLLRHV